jgi:SAM-dependent methyltransferase
MKNPVTQHNVIREEFRKQAAGWGQRQDNLTEAAQLLALQGDFTVLDVAAGSALLTSAIAPHVRHVVAVDITPEMLQQAREKDINNMWCEMGAAENLPHAATFDRVVTRYSLHHMQDPQPVIEEIYRVCKPGGSALIMDIVAPEDAAIAAHYNHLERLRDPSHTTALMLSALKQMIATAGFTVTHTSINPNGEMDLEGWFDLAQTPPAHREEIRAALEDELNGGLMTGFHPVYRDGRFKIVHTISTLVAAKAG